MGRLFGGRAMARPRHSLLHHGLKRNHPAGRDEDGGGRQMADLRRFRCVWTEADIGGDYPGYLRMGVREAGILGSGRGLWQVEIGRCFGSKGGVGEVLKGLTDWVVGWWW